MSIYKSWQPQVGIHQPFSSYSQVNQQGGKINNELNIAHLLKNHVRKPYKNIQILL